MTNEYRPALSNKLPSLFHFLPARLDCDILEGLDFALSFSVPPRGLAKLFVPNAYLINICCWTINWVIITTGTSPTS